LKRIQVKKVLFFAQKLADKFGVKAITENITESS